MLLSGGEEFGLITGITEMLGISPAVASTTAPYYTAALVALVLAGLLLPVWLRVRAPASYLIPEATMTITSFFDAMVQGIGEFLEGAMGPAAHRHLPLLGTVFIYIFFANAIGLIPGMTPPTSNLHTNLAIALVVFIYYNVVGIKAQGISNYLRHLMGPVLWLAPLLFLIELVSHIVRPLSLSIRLFGNMTADHAVLEVFTDLTGLFVPVAFYGLGLFVCLVQAFVFTLLSAVYIGLAEGDGDNH